MYSLLELIEELSKKYYCIPFLYFHLEGNDESCTLQLEWYPDSCGKELFNSSCVRDILNLEIKLEDSFQNYKKIIFKESKNGLDLSEYLGVEIHK